MGSEKITEAHCKTLTEGKNNRFVENRRSGFHCLVVWTITLTLKLSTWNKAVSAWTHVSPYSSKVEHRYQQARHRFHRFDVLNSIKKRIIENKSLHESSTFLRGGIGIASDYSWKEEQFEIEVTISVPPNTNASDINFKCYSNAIDLRVMDSSKGERILLDGKRMMRGKICIDGTFWSISNVYESVTSKENVDQTPMIVENRKEITVTIEKQFVPISSIGGTITYDQRTDFDWGGLYLNDHSEVIFRKYDEAEELNIKEYAAKLGVDIDNMDMRKVNKTMFGTGSSGATDFNTNMEGFHFNVTQSALDQLVRAGLAEEVVQQRDGIELDSFSRGLNEESFSILGNDLHPNSAAGGDITEVLKKDIFFQVQEGTSETYDAVSKHAMKREDTSCSDDAGNDAAFYIERGVNSVGMEQGETDDNDAVDLNPEDPIDRLSVTRLKEILRQYGLKVSGTKQVLRERLCNYVNSLLMQE